MAYEEAQGISVLDVKARASRIVVQPGIWVLRSSGGGLVRLSTSKDDRLPRWRPR